MLVIYSNDYDGYLPAAYNGSYAWPEILCRMDYLKWPRTGTSSALICPGFEPKVYKQTDGRFLTTYGMWIGDSKYGPFTGTGLYYYIKLQRLENTRITIADSAISGSYPNGIQNYYLDSGNGTELIAGSIRTVHVRHAGHNSAHAAFSDGSSRSVTSGWLAKDARYYWRR